MQPTPQIPIGRSGLIGPYRVITTIGAGGMAEVLKVEDTRTGQYRAMKIHYAPTQDEAVLLSYKREQRAMQRCDHPNVVRIFDYGVHEDRPYIVMEFVPGVPLTDFLEERGLQPGPERDKMAALLALQIASALDHVHGRNLVHRDLKPANILVTQDEIVKLIDFGIARDLGQDFELEPDQGSDVVGTYAYCSPEQVSGIPVDHRSDLYSFGVVLYLLITDHLPFVAEQAVAYILKHVNAAPEPPESYYPDIPPILRDIILKLLKKKPVDRPQSGRDVQQALKAFVDSITRELWVPPEEVSQSTGEVVPRLRLYEPAFIGRAREQGLLEGAISLVQGGAGGVVLIEGEVGSGKSRLMDIALADARARGLSVFSARCLPEADRPYQGILELVDAVVATLGAKRLEAVQTRIGAYLPILARAFPPVARLLPNDSPEVADADPRIELERIRVALKAFIDAVLPGPTVLALKDLQWADHATMSLIASVSSPTTAAAPVLWLGSVSTDELTGDHSLKAWLANPPPQVQVINVWPLEVEEVESLVRSMLGGNLELGLLAVDLYRETRGNPLFIAETVRALVDSGRLQPHLHEDGEVTGWTFRLGSSSSGGLVHTIRETLAARLTRLPSQALAMLERLSILGRPGSFEWLRVVTGASEEQLLDTIDDVLGRRILVERKGARNSIFSFYHPKMAEVVRNQIGPDRLEHLHIEVAEAWFKVHGDGDPASVELLATHLFNGRDYQRALPYLLRAAEARLRLGLYEAALHLLDRGLECCSQGGVEIDRRLRATVHLRLGRVLQHLGNLERAWSHLKSAYQEAQSQGFSEIQGQALYLLARLTSRQGDFATSCKHYAEALKIQRGCQDHTGLLRSMHGLASSLWYLGDLPHARRLFEESIASARRLGDSGLIAQSISGLGMVAAHEGRFAEAATHFMEASVLSRAGGRDAFYLHCQLNEAEVRRVQGDLGTARSLVATVVEKLERVGERDAVASAFNEQAAIAIELRDLERAERYLMRAGEVLQRTPHYYARAIRQLLVGQLELVRGRPVEAQLGLTEALTVADGQQYREIVARAHRFLASALTQCGSPAEGLALMRRAISETEKISNAPGTAEGKLFLAEGLLIQGERTEVSSLLEQVSRSFREMGMHLLLIRSLVLRGRIAFDSGLYELARTLLGESLRHAREIRAGLTPEERSTFDTRPEIRLLGALWRSMPPVDGHEP